MPDAKGRTRWFPRHVYPARVGEYECAVRITSAQRKLMLQRLHWDGIGFLVPAPMVVVQWRGLTERAAAAQQEATHG